jgi:hypothetical protein
MPPSMKCSPSISYAGKRPGTADDASTAGTIGPEVNQCSAARSIEAAQHMNGTRRSSMSVTVRCRSTSACRASGP